MNARILAALLSFLPLAAWALGSPFVNGSTFTGGVLSQYTTTTQCTTSNSSGSTAININPGTSNSCSGSSAATSNNWQFTINANGALNITFTAPGTILMEMVEGSPGGFTPTAGTGVTFANGLAFNTASGGITLLTAYYDGTNITVVGGQVPTYSGLNTWTNQNVLNLNSASVSCQTGDILCLINANTTGGGLSIFSFGAIPGVNLIRYDGTAASGTTIQSGNVLGTIGAGGFNGSTVALNTGYCAPTASQNWTSSAEGTALDCYVTANGATTQTQAFAAGNDGGFTVGTATDEGANTLNAGTLYEGGTALGTAALDNTGTSGATIPLLNGTNTWSAGQTYSGITTTWSGNFTRAAYTTSGALLAVGGSTVTDSTSSGTVTEAAVNAIGAPTMAASSVTTYTTADTFRIAGAPTAGTDVTITHGYALNVVGGLTNLGGGASIIGTTTINSSGSSSTTIGNSSSTDAIAGGTVTMANLGSSATGDYVCWNSGTLGQNGSTCTLSDENAKQDILPLEDGLAEVMKFDPVSFRYRDGHGLDTSVVHVGFTAQRMDKVDKRLVEYDADGKPHAVAYEVITAVLTKAIQEQNRQIMFLYLWCGLLTLGLGYTSLRRR